jgi:uncharacterized protein (DUF1499 family)
MTALLLGLATVAVVVLAGLGTRWGWWPYYVGLGLLAAGGGLGALATVVTAVRAMGPWRGGGAVPWLDVAGLLPAAAVLCLLATWAVKGATSPPIHDISTDLEDPPPFRAVLARRPPSSNSAVHAGPRLAAKQRKAYPDVAPLTLAAPPEEAMERALAAVHAFEWEVVEVDRAAGRVEATSRTKWFGFRDDVVVRLTPEPGGTRVDVRSASRVGAGDAGTNAKRIRAFLARLAEG